MKLKFRPIKPMGVSINQPLWKRVLHWMTAMGFSIVLAALLMEWMAGCGESYVDSKGVTHLNECLFINRGESK